MDKIASIILTTYCNSAERAELAKQCFNTVHLTGYSRNEYELICVNDGGAYQDTTNLDSDIEIKNKVPIGIGEAKNQAIALATGKYISIVDDDVLFNDGWLREAIGLLEKYPNEKFVASVRYLGSPERYKIGEIDGYLLLCKVGGWWTLPREFFNGRKFEGSIYDDRNFWKIHLKPNGYKFILSKVPYVFHLGDHKSSILPRFCKNYPNYENTVLQRK